MILVQLVVPCQVEQQLKIVISMTNVFYYFLTLNNHVGHPFPNLRMPWLSKNLSDDSDEREMKMKYFKINEE